MTQKRPTLAHSLIAGLLPLSLTALGCSDESSDGKGGGKLSEDAGAEAQAPTWHEHIAPLVKEKCSGCHQEGGIAPFSVESYAEAKDFASVMVNAVEEGVMPPFLAQETDECAPRLPWQSDLRLSDEEKGLLREWARAGAPEGDPKKAAALPEPPSLELPREDVVLRLPAPITVSGNKDLHTCVIVDPKLTEDVYVTGRQIIAGNEKVLHHVVSYVIAPGTNEDGTPRTKAQLEAALQAEKGVGIGDRYDCFGGPGLGSLETQILDAWAPGGVPNLAPPNSGQPVAKDSLVLLDVHYHPIGAPETDEDTRLTLMLAESRPLLISRVILLGNFPNKVDTEFGVGEIMTQDDEDEAEFLVPPGARDHIEEMRWTWKLPEGQSLRVYSAGTHMHYVGRDERIGLERANPTGDEPAEECLLQTPAWDFNWQRGYAYDASFEKLPTMKNGDVLTVRCRYDNSMDNPFVRAALDEQGLPAPVDVRLGEDTLDEMCLAAIGIIHLNL